MEITTIPDLELQELQKPKVIRQAKIPGSSIPSGCHETSPWHDQPTHGERIQALAEAQDRSINEIALDLIDAHLDRERS